MLTKDIVDKLFQYKNGKLYWKSSNGSMKVGSQVGCITATIKGSKGYYATRIKGRRIYLHKIVFFMFHNYIPKRIRFLDGNTLNYSIENLKDCTSSEILFRAKIRNDNTSGYKGISWSKRRNKWVGWISKDKKKTWLGYFDSKNKAYQAYINKSIELYGEDNSN